MVGVDRLERAVLGLQPDAAVGSRGRRSSPSPRRRTRRRPASATTMSPFRASSRRCTTSVSPSRIPASIIESPLTVSRKSAPVPSGSGTREHILDVLLGEQRRAGGDAAEQRQAHDVVVVSGCDGGRCGLDAPVPDQRRSRGAWSGHGGSVPRARCSRGARARWTARQARLPHRSRARSAGSHAPPRTRRGTARSRCCRVVSTVCCLPEIVVTNVCSLRKRRALLGRRQHFLAGVGEGGAVETSLAPTGTMIHTYG